MMEVVGAAADHRQLRWWDPFGGTVGACVDAPAFVEQFVVGWAGLGEFVDVGQSAFGPFVDVVDFAAVAGGVTAGSGAAAVFGKTVLVVHPYPRRASGRGTPQRIRA